MDAPRPQCLSLYDQVARGPATAVASTADAGHHLADALPQIIWSARPDGTLDYFNRWAREFIGLAPEAGLGSDWIALLHPDDVPATTGRWMNSLRTGEPLEVQFRLRNAAGQYRWQLSRGAPARNAAGQIEHWYGTCTDIHDQKLVEESLRQSQTTLGLALEAANVATWRMDLPARRIHWDPRMFAMFGQSPETFTPSPESLVPLLLPEDRARVDAEFTRGVQMPPGSLLDLEFRIRLPDGSIRHINCRMMRCEDDGEQRLHGVCIDITQRARARQLETERNALDSALLAMEQVLGVVGHELRTPLATMRIMLELLLSGDPAPLDPAQMLHALRAESSHMADVICNLLDAARLNGGHMRWNWGPVDLREICSQVSTTVTPLLPPSGPSLAFDLHPAGLTMTGDADAIRRLILNLVTNAVKHTPAGAITIRARHADGAPNRVLLEIRDTGRGMEPHIARKLGEPFVLGAHSITDSLLKGCGLGLTICRGIAAAHAGRIRVHSDRGRGTCITVDLAAHLPGPVQEYRPEPIAVLHSA